MVNKGVIVLGSLAAGGVLVFLLNHKAKAGPGPGEGNVVIEILDENGNPVPRGNSFDLTEGQNYSVRLSVKNTSTKAGQTWPATLIIGLVVKLGGANLITPVNSLVSFAAGEQKAFNYPFSLLLGDGGKTGAIAASLGDPEGGILGSASDVINVVEIPIVYGGTISIG